MKKKKIRALEIKPMEHPTVCYIEPTMKAIRGAVGTDLIEHGNVEAKRLGKYVYVIFNKDRFLADLEPNRQIGDDIICGTIYVIAVDEDGFLVSLTDKQIAKYALLFYDTEEFEEIDVAEANITTLMSRLWKDEECGV